MTAFALVLILAAAAGWIASGGAPERARAYLRMAAVLYAALAVAGLALNAAAGVVALPASAAPAVIAVSDLVTTLGPAVLCVAAYSVFRRAPHTVTTSLVLALAALLGLAAAAGLRVLAAAPQVVSAVFTLLLARPGLWRRAYLYLALAGLSMLGGAACQLSDGLTARAGVLLFEAAALVGVAVASNVFVEQRRKDKRGLLVRRAR